MDFTLKYIIHELTKYYNDFYIKDKQNGDTSLIKQEWGIDGS